MSLKEFFRPTKLKIILVILLFLTRLLFLPLVFLQAPVCKFNTCPFSKEDLSWSFYKYYTISDVIRPGGVGEFIFIPYFIYAIELFMIYFLVCLIVYNQEVDLKKFFKPSLLKGVILAPISIILFYGNPCYMFCAYWGFKWGYWQFLECRPIGRLFEFIQDVCDPIGGNKWFMSALLISILLVSYFLVCLGVFLTKRIGKRKR